MTSRQTHNSPKPRSRAPAASFAAVLLAGCSLTSLAHAQAVSGADKEQQIAQAQLQISDAQARVLAAQAELAHAQAELAQMQSGVEPRPVQLAQASAPQ